MFIKACIERFYSLVFDTGYVKIRYLIAQNIAQNKKGYFDKKDHEFRQEAGFG